MYKRQAQHPADIARLILRHGVQPVNDTLPFLKGIYADAMIAERTGDNKAGPQICAQFGGKADAAFRIHTAPVITCLLYTSG